MQSQNQNAVPKTSALLLTVCQSVVPTRLLLALVRVTLPYAFIFIIVSGSWFQHSNILSRVVQMTSACDLHLRAVMISQTCQFCSIVLHLQTATNCFTQKRSHRRRNQTRHIENMYFSNKLTKFIASKGNQEILSNFIQGEYF